MNVSTAAHSPHLSDADLQGAFYLVICAPLAASSLPVSASVFDVGCVSPLLPLLAPLLRAADSDSSSSTSSRSSGHSCDLWRVCLVPSFGCLLPFPVSPASSLRHFLDVVLSRLHFVDFCFPPPFIPFIHSFIHPSFVSSFSSSSLTLSPCSFGHPPHSHPLSFILSSTLSTPTLSLSTSPYNSSCSSNSAHRSSPVDSSPCLHYENLVLIPPPSPGDLQRNPTCQRYRSYPPLAVSQTGNICAQHKHKISLGNPCCPTPFADVFLLMDHHH